MKDTPATVSLADDAPIELSSFNKRVSSPFGHVAKKESAIKKSSKKSYDIIL